MFPTIVSFLTALTTPFTVAARAWLDRKLPMKAVDIDGDGSANYHIPHHPVVFYAKNLLPSLVLNALVQLVSSAIFVALEPRCAQR